VMSARRFRYANRAGPKSSLNARGEKTEIQILDFRAKNAEKKL